MFLIIGILIFGYLTSSLLSWLNIRHLQANIDSSLPDSISSQFDNQKKRQIVDYTTAKAFMGYWSNFIETAVVVILFAAGIVKTLAVLANSIIAPPLLQGLVVMYVLMIIGFVFGIPVSLYSSFILEKKYGFSTIKPKTWMGDQVKTLLISAILMGLLFAGFYASITWLGKWWWFAAWILIVLFTILFNFLAPAVIMPMFNKFVSLEDHELRDKILAMAKKAEFPLSGVFQMDASKRSTHDNAFFAGMGKTRKIVFYDTMVKNYSHDEILSVMGHEVGHWKLNHLFKKIVAVSAILGVMLYLASLILAHPWIYNAIGLEDLFSLIGFKGAIVGVALYVVTILFEPLNLLLSPFMNWLSRKYEYQSDAYSLALNPSAHDMKEALIKLNQKNLSNLFPHPLYVAFHYSHPPLLERLSAIDKISNK